MTAYEVQSLAVQKRRTNAVVFIAWVVGIFSALSLIGLVVVAIMVGHTSSVLDSPAGTGGILNCQSVGGSDPSC
jgi:hypothetical protein